MKKLMFVAVALCATMLMSCAKTDEEPIIEEVVDVKFAIGAENEMSTRAISDGTGATQLMYGVFNDQGELVIAKAVKDNVTGLTSTNGYTMTISLVKGHAYQVVFWAQDSDCTAYTVSDDMQVSIDYTGMNNDETRDAFFGKTEVFRVEQATTIPATLKRPFAQVNVGAFPFDFEHAQAMGVDISKSSATINGIANQINLLDGEVTGEVNVTYSLGDIPAEDLTVDVDSNGVTETYEWLSMSYLLANKTQTVHTMAFAFADAEGGDNITFDGERLNAIPIQRNYRTNIVGQILTGTVSFNIKIDPIYEGESINSAGLYYNFSEDTTIANKVFAFNTLEDAIFTSENNNLITMTNVTFSGKVQYIAMGDYIKNASNKVIVPFRNNMTNVKAENMVVTHSKGIANVEPIDYMAPLFFLRGETTLTDCTFTGTTFTPSEDYVDYWGDKHVALVYDCGVPNDCVATFNNCTIDRMYAWSHSQVTLKNTKVQYIRCSTHNNTQATSHLTIDAGSVVDKIFVTSSKTTQRYTDENGNTHWDINNMWSPSLIIKAGAEVKVLDMNGRSRYDNNGNLDVIIEEGATVGQIINEGTGIPSTES